MTLRLHNLKSLFLNNRARLQWAAVWFWMCSLLGQAALQGLSPCACMSSSSSQPGPQGSASIPIIIIMKRIEKKIIFITSHSCDLVFLQQTLVFQDFSAMETSPRHAPTCTSMHTHEIPACSAVQWHTWECLQMTGTGKSEPPENIPPKHPKLTKATSEITGVYAATAFPRRKQTASSATRRRSNITSSGMEGGQLSCCPEVMIQTSLMRWHASLYPHMD